MQIIIYHHRNYFRDLGCHAEAKAIMVTVVGHIGCQMETGQQRLRIAEVDMINPPSSLVSGACHKLLEAKITEGCEE